MFAIFIAAMPSSYFVNELIRIVRSMNFISEQLEAPLQYLGMFVLGCLQYFVLGFILATVVRYMVMRVVGLVRQPRVKKSK